MWPGSRVRVLANTFQIKCGKRESSDGIASSEVCLCVTWVLQLCWGQLGALEKSVCKGFAQGVSWVEKA